MDFKKYLQRILCDPANYFVDKFQMQAGGILKFYSQKTAKEKRR